MFNSDLEEGDRAGIGYLVNKEVTSHTVRLRDTEEHCDRIGGIDISERVIHLLDHVVIFQFKPSLDYILNIVVVEVEVGFELGNIFICTIYARLVLKILLIDEGNCTSMNAFFKTYFLI